MRAVVKVIGPRGNREFVLNHKQTKKLDVRGHVQLCDLIEDLLDHRANSQVVTSDVIKDFIRSQRCTLWMDWDITDESELNLATSWFMDQVERLNAYAESRSNGT